MVSFSKTLVMFLRMKYSSDTVLVVKKNTSTAAINKVFMIKVAKYVSGSKLISTLVERFSLSSWYFF